MKKEKEIIDAEIVDAEVVDGYESTEEEIIVEDILGKQTVKIGDKTVVRVYGEDIVTYGPNNEVLSCSLPRVDLDNQDSIIDYGSEYIVAISTLLKEVSQAAIADDSSAISNELVESITSFDDSIAETRKKREKEENLPAIIKSGKTFLARLGFEQFAESSKNTDEECYKQYCNRIVELTNGVIQQAESCRKDQQLRSDTVRDIMPYIHKLNIALNVGEIDLETYKAKTTELENGTFSMDITFEIDRRKNNADDFFITLGDLRKDLSLYQTQIGGYAAQQKIDSSIIRTSARWVKVVAPILEANANLNLFNYRQAKRLMLMAKIDEAGNEAIAESGSNLKANADLAVKLETEGGLKLETIAGVHAQVLEGSRILGESRTKLIARVEKEKENLEKICAEEGRLQGKLSSQTNGGLLLEDGNKQKVKAIGSIKY